MTVETTNAGPWFFTASGATGTFNVSTPSRDVSAFTLKARNTSTDEIYTPTFTAALATDGSGITFTVTAGLTSGHEVSVYRVPYGQQPSALQSHGPWPASVNERQHDRAALDTLALWLLARRSLRAPMVDADDLNDLPPKALRLGKYLQFDLTTGQPNAVSALTVGSLSVSAFMESLLDDASAAAARATLGIGDVTGPVIMGLVSGTGAATGLTAQAVLNLLAAQAAGGAGAIAGWTYANNGTDATNDLDIVAGSGVDSAGAIWMKGAALTKRLDATWAVGNNQGGRLSGSLADGGYNVWAIGRSDDFSVDYGFETDANATPTLPSGYGHYRKIGWFRRVSGAILGFNTYQMDGGGLRLEYKVPSLDKNISTLGTSRITDQFISIPPFRCLALLRVLISNNSAAAAAFVGNPDETDVAPQAVAGQGADLVTDAAGAIALQVMRTMTSATGTIAARSSNGSTIYRVWPLGFEMSRR